MPGISPGITYYSYDFNMRALLFWTFLLTSFCLFAQEAQNSPENKYEVRWGLAPSFNINIPGGWKSTDSYDNSSFGYGGGLGLICKLTTRRDFFFESGLSFGYDELKLCAVDKESDDLSLTKWSVSLPLTVGYQLNFSDRLRLSPLAGLALSYSFGCETRSETLIMKPFNLSAGFGFGIQRDEICVGIMGYFGLLPVIRPEKSVKMNDNKVCVTAKYYFN